MNNRGQKFGGDWTELKLDCVSKYLHEYTKIMNNYTFYFPYIDAFAVRDTVNWNVMMTQ